MTPKQLEVLEFALKCQPEDRVIELVEEFIYNAEVAAWNDAIDAAIAKPHLMANLKKPSSS